MAELRLSHQVQGKLKILFRFTRKANNHIGSKVEIGHLVTEFFNDIHERFYRIHASHFQENRVRSALNAKVHVGCHFGMLEKAMEFGSETIRFQRGDSHPEVTRQFKDFLNHSFDSQSLVIITSYVYTCDYNLLKSIVNNPAYIFQDLFNGTTYSPSPDRWDNAVGAEIVASILYLDGSTGMQALIDRFEPKYVSRKGIGMNHFPFKMGINEGYNLTFPFIINHISYLFVGFQLLFVVIGHTPGYNHQSVLVLPGSVTDGIPRFLVTLVCNSTGIDHCDISRFGIIDHLVTGLVKLGDQGIGFILVQAATQCFK